MFTDLEGSDVNQEAAQWEHETNAWIEETTMSLSLEDQHKMNKEYHAVLDRMKTTLDVD